MILSAASPYFVCANVCSFVGVFNVAALMAGVWLALCPLLLSFILTLCLDVNQIQGMILCLFLNALLVDFNNVCNVCLSVPTDDGISGVLLVQTKDKKYSFNATTAKEACDAINMRIATKAEVETANKHGLQTCRYSKAVKYITLYLYIMIIENNQAY